MKSKSLNQLVSNYQSQLAKGEIQVAYRALVKGVMNLKTQFSRTYGDRYSFGSIFQGYMDYTYFYFTNERYHSRKLKLGLVLNPEKMRFELWLLAQTKDLQERYWNLLQHTEWIQETKMPKYAVFEKVLVEHPDFDEPEALLEAMGAMMILTADRIIESISQIETIDKP
jgi:hypothetical protein